MATPKPRAFIEENPTSQNIKLGGVSLNSSRLAEYTGYSLSQVTRILNGVKPGSVKSLQVMAAALHMSTDGLLAAIETRRKELQAIKDSRR